MLKAVIAVGLGSFTGGVLRYLASKAVPAVADGRFPASTLVVNLTGCLIIGLLSGLAEKGFAADTGLRLFLTAGVCGGFTTFSAFMNESLALARGGHSLMLAAYIALSVFGGFLLVFAGYAAARHL